MNYFELYDIPESLQPDAALVRRKWGEVSRVYHPDRYVNATAAERAEALQRTSLNNDAYRTLMSPDAALAYVLKLHGVLADEEKYSLPPAFLMEMMELNEAIDNADEAQQAQHEYEQVLAGWTAGMAALTRRFTDGERSAELLAALKDYHFRKKYLLRLKERMA